MATQISLEIDDELFEAVAAMAENGGMSIQDFIQLKLEGEAYRKGELTRGWASRFHRYFERDGLTGDDWEAAFGDESAKAEAS